MRIFQNRWIMGTQRQFSENICSKDPLEQGIWMGEMGLFQPEKSGKSNQCMTRFKLKLAYVTWRGYAMVSDIDVFG